MILTAEQAESAEMKEKNNLDLITRRIIGAGIEVHRHLGPGLLESAYQTCLAFELRQLGRKVEEQKPLPVMYKDVKLDCGYRLDLVIDDAVVVEIKAVERLMPIHDAVIVISPAFEKASRPAD